MLKVFGDFKIICHIWIISETVEKGLSRELF